MQGVCGIRIKRNGEVEKVSIPTDGRFFSAKSLAAHKDRLFFIERCVSITEVLVIALNVFKLLTSWTVPHYGYFG